MAQNERHAEKEARQRPVGAAPSPVIVPGVPMRMEFKCLACRHQAIVNIFVRPGHEPKFHCSKCGDCDPAVTHIRR